MARKRPTSPPEPTSPPAPEQPPPDLLKGAAQRATKAKPKTKAELPSKKLDPELEKEVSALIRLATIQNEFDPLVSQYKKSIGQKLLDIWVKELWVTKKVPSNFRCPIMKKEGDKNSLKKDMDTTFQVKFRSDGLTSVVPDAAELPEGETVEDKLHEMLTSEQVGLSENNADKILHTDTGDIQVISQLTLTDSLNNLYHSSNDVVRSGATKLLQYLQAYGQPTITLPILTEEESAGVLTTKQVVIVREGFFERVCTYCRNEAELGRLIRFIRPTLQLGSFEFGVSDKKSERVERLSQTVLDFLSVGDE